MSNLLEGSLKVAKKSYPPRRVSEMFDIPVDGWIKLGFTIVDAFNEKKKPFQEVLDALGDEVIKDSDLHPERKPHIDKLLNRLGLMSVGIWNLNHEKIKMGSIIFPQKNLYMKLTSKTT